MQWLNLALMAAIAGGLVVLLTAEQARLWLFTRLVARFCFQGAAVLAIAWLLISLASNANAAVSGFAPASFHDTPTQLVTAISKAAGPSLLLIFLAIIFGTGSGLAAAIVVTARKQVDLRFVAVIATVAWALPTFLVAILAQQAQALIYSFTGATTSGGYAQLTPLALFWATVVLGIRPAAYVYRQARVALDLQSIADHVRAGRARGLPEPLIAMRYIVRPASSALVAGWLNSIRVVIGALPLVEFFFAYPGVGQMLLFSIGIHYQGVAGTPGAADPDLAIAAALFLAGLLLVLESVALSAQSLLDPRIREIRAV
jgi:peptide/nickel transport system permease protein